MEIINPEVAIFINAFNKNSLARLNEFRNDCEQDHIPIIRNDTESFLINLLRIIKPERILEIGTGAGYSSTVFSLTCPKASIKTLEMIDKRIELAKSNFCKFGVENMIELVEGDASESLAKIVSETGEDELFDFVFIDCAKSRYKEFFLNSMAVTKPGGIIICDNVLLDGRTASDSFIENRRDKTSTMRMREFMDWLINNEDPEGTSLLNIGDGLTLSII